MQLPAAGAHFQLGDGTRFRVWAPRPRALELELTLAPGGDVRVLPLDRDGGGYAEVLVPEAAPGTRYRYRLLTADGAWISRPDPASRFQPEGVHGPSEVIAPHGVGVAAPGRDWNEYVFYEAHIGTFTRAGTFAAAAAELPRLAALGITAFELMPVAQFPGGRNWGYDGVYPFAAQNTYGGPAALAALVAACHRASLAAVLDVVDNHLGPEGNYCAGFGPYFTSRYRTPWGDALNFDGPDSEPVRRFFLDNALYWLDEVGFDALRLDAIHGIFDQSAYPFLAELADTVAALAARRSRKLYLIAESDLNDVRALRPTADGGLGMPAQWSDDFHHALHARLTGERQGYYADFGGIGAVAAAVRDNFVYRGQYSAYRRRRHGSDARGYDPRRFVVAAQNHDQIGNRAQGERLAQLVPPAAVRAAAACLLLSPATPLLFMGEEWGETAPFPYFISHGDPALVAAVRRGRAAEFAEISCGPGPDPHDAATFASARLRPEAGDPRLTGFYRELLALRRGMAPGTPMAAARRCPEQSGHPLPAIEVRPSSDQRERPRQKVDVPPVASDPSAQLVSWTLEGSDGRLLLLARLDPGTAVTMLDAVVPPGNWRRVLSSEDPAWGGAGARLPQRLPPPEPLRLEGFEVALYRAAGNEPGPGRN